MKMVVVMVLAHGDGKTELKVGQRFGEESESERSDFTSAIVVLDKCHSV